MKYRTKAGFTLIELLITVTVIGILSTIAFLGVQNTLISNRDRTRLESIRAISNALENYYNDNGEYPLGSELNTGNTVTELSATDFSNVKTVLPELSDSHINGPSGYKFFSYCSYTSPGPCAALTGSDWLTYHSKQYLYITTYAAATDPQIVQTAYLVGGNTGWGCSVTLRYSDPGYVLAYRREADGGWSFYRSRKGNVTLSNYSSPNNPPSGCVFSTL